MPRWRSRQRWRENRAGVDPGNLIPSDELFARILPLARAHDLTVHDTLYLELAGRRGLALASFDNKLDVATRRVGIELVEEAA